MIFSTEQLKYSIKASLRITSSVINLGNCFHWKLASLFLSRDWKAFAWLLCTLVFEISVKSGIPGGVRGDEIVRVDVSEVSYNFWIELGGWPSWFEFLVQALENAIIYLFFQIASSDMVVNIGLGSTKPFDSIVQIEINLFLLLWGGVVFLKLL